METEEEYDVIDNVLIYKRNHTGDPNADGIFGINDCMGQVRNWKYRAIIGIGVREPWSGFEEIAKKITWIGIGPTRHKTQLARNPLVTFDNFCLLDATGPFVEDIAPKLYEHMLGDVNRRIVKYSLPNFCKPEVRAILALACGWPASKGKLNIQTVLDQFNNTHSIESQCPSGCHSQDQTPTTTEVPTKHCKC